MSRRPSASLVVRRSCSRSLLPALALGLPALQGGTSSADKPARLDVAGHVLVDPPDGVRCRSRWSAALIFAVVRAPPQARPAAAASAAALPDSPRGAFLKRVGGARPLPVSASLAARAAGAEKPRADLDARRLRRSSTRLSRAIAAETVAEFADKGPDGRGPLDRRHRPDAGTAAAASFPAGGLPRRRVVLPVLGRQALLSLLLRVAEGGGQAHGHARARPRRQGHDHGLLERRDRLRRRLDHRHDLRPRARRRRVGATGRRSATSSTTGIAARGYTNLNANQKTFCEDAYGREQAFRDGGKNRNRMTAAEAARIFKEIVRGEVAGDGRPTEMLALLARDDRAPRSPSRTWSSRTRAWPARACRRAAASGRSPATPTTSTTSSPASSCRTGRTSSSRSSRRASRTCPGVIPRVYEKVAAHFAAPPRPVRRTRMLGVAHRAAGLVGAGILGLRATIRIERAPSRSASRPCRRAGVPFIYTLWHGRMVLLHPRPPARGHRDDGLALEGRRDHRALARRATATSRARLDGQGRTGGPRRDGRATSAPATAAALTIDGPKGPPRVAQPGVLRLARETGAWILPYHRRERPAVVPEVLGPLPRARSPSPAASSATASPSRSPGACPTREALARIGAAVDAITRRGGPRPWASSPPPPWEPLGELGENSSPCPST